MERSGKQIILLLGDIFFLYSALYLTLFLRYQTLPSANLWEMHILPFTVIFIIWLIIFYITNLYSFNLLANKTTFYRAASKSIMVNAGWTITFFYLFPNLAIAPKTNLFIFLVIFSLLFISWRNIFNWLLRSRFPKQNIAIVGLNKSTLSLLTELKKNYNGYHTSFVVRTDNLPLETIYNDLEIIDDLTQLEDQIINHQIKLVVIASDPRESQELKNALFKLLPLKINFVNLPEFFEMIAGKIPLELITQLWFLENLNERDKALFDLFKKIFDKALSFLLLVITLPFWPIVAIIIKLESRGPVFIKMERVGQYGKIFKMFKFRTMKEEGNDRTITVKNDPRITRVGSILRKTRIDEIPQMINILKGDMSFVGPRPERPEIVTELERQIPFFNERTLVKPGVTGWDQISGEYHSPTVEDSIKKMQYDLFYIKNRSLYFDLSIILKTIATVFSRSGR